MVKNSLLHLQLTAILLSKLFLKIKLLTQIRKHSHKLQVTLLSLAFLIIGASPSLSNINYNNYPALKKANYIMLIDQDSGQILLEKNSKQRLAPSSMTKLMTAYVVFSKLKEGVISLENQCKVDREAWRKKGSTMFLNQGDIVNIDELLRGLLVVSGNDAAVSLAKAISGSTKEFVKLMNKTAKEIGLTNSNFINPYGLNKKNHYMTLKDLATLSIKLRKEFPEYCSKYFTIEHLTYGNITQKNRNPLLKNSYEGVTGMKTGYTSNGGYGMVGSASRNNFNLIAIVNDTKSSRERQQVIEQLLDFGFNEHQKITLFTKGQKITKVKTWLGNKRNVTLTTNQDISFIIKKKDLVSNKIETKIRYLGPIHAPIKKNQEMATMEIDLPYNKELKVAKLVAKENIDKVGYLKIVYQIIKHKLQSIFT